MSQKNNKTIVAILLIILIGALLSSILYINTDTGYLDITHISASVTFVKDGTELLVEPQLENTRKSDSGSITLKIKVKDDRYSNTILGQGTNSIGYIKKDDTQKINVFIPMSGEVVGLYYIEIDMFEGEEYLLTRSARINIPKPGSVILDSDLRFVDMEGIVTRITNESALISFSPGVKNVGGISKVVTLNLILNDADSGRMVDQEGENLGIIKSGETKFGDVSFISEVNNSYDISIEVFENGKDKIKGSVVDTLDLKTVKEDTSLKFQILEKGVPPISTPVTPVPTEPPSEADVGVDYEMPPSEEPGFESIFAIVGLLAVAYLLRRNKR